jgi:hypothetical protein
VSQTASLFGVSEEFRLLPIDELYDWICNKMRFERYIHATSVGPDTSSHFEKHNYRRMFTARSAGFLAFPAVSTDAERFEVQDYGIHHP